MKTYRTISVLAVFVVLVLASANLRAAFEFKESGARGAALAGAYTAVCDDAEAMWQNPAGLRLCSGIQTGMVYTDLYGLKDLRYVNLSLVVPTLQAGTWGFGYSSFGPADYRETDLRCSFASGLGSGMYIGATLKNNSLSIGNGGGTAGCLGIDLGVTANISEKFRMGVGALNVNGTTFGNTSEMPARRFMAGIQVKPHPGLSLSLDLHKPLEKEMEARTGVEVNLDENFTLRAGAQAVPSRFVFGFGVNWSVFSLNYAFLTHAVLMPQHIFSLQTAFGPKERRRVPIEKAKPEKKFSGKIDINTADADRLSLLPGIGKITAKKIIEYREKTGRFREISDIMNIYGFSKTKYEKIKDYIIAGEEKKVIKKSPEPGVTENKADIQPPVIKSQEQPKPQPQETVQESKPDNKKSRININEANIKELTQIPGISYPMAQNIVRHRRQWGKFKVWGDLLSVPGMNLPLLENIKKASSLGSD